MFPPLTKAPFVIVSCFLFLLVGAGQPADLPRFQEPTQGPPSAENTEKKSRTQVALDLVESVVAEAGNFEPESQGMLLAVAGSVLAKADPRRSRAYYEAAFQASERMGLVSGLNARVGVQEGIVAALAARDPDLAFELLHRVDKPHWTGYSEQDIRTRSGRLLVQSFLARNGKGDLEKAAETVTYLGQTGQYPYRAAATLIDFFVKLPEQPRADQVFSEALQQFSHDTEFESTPDDFARLILAVSDNISPSLITRAIRVLIESTRSREDEWAKKDTTSERSFVLSTDQGRLRFSRRASYLSFLLLPVAMRLDPKLARDLREQNDELKRMSETMSSQSIQKWGAGTGVVFQGGAPSQKALQAVQKEGDTFRALATVEQIAQKEPDKAITRAKQIDSAGGMARGLAIIANHIAASDPKRAGSLLDEAEGLADKEQEKAERVRALAEIASGWVKLGESSRASHFIKDGIALSREVYAAEEDDGEPASFMVRPSLRLFDGLIQVQDELDPDESIRLAGTLQNPRIRCHLMLQISRYLLTDQKKQ
jgi:hypothetical protein